ncbi:hypothetical protein JQ612_28775 [Bradyrhizobium manausense]|uniref:DUF6064 family protein n=1 Tax=Bradyrhizobium manausense TaxID=989370 RepID=UPI001BA9A752|nr:DUF6064 family protein [Bradyrhizobium manausense]MBR0837206.1 hypothetical protein [Bradyrhizobium manausense]
MLPFTPEQFLAVFSDYNQAIWPVQVAAYLLGAFAVILLFFKRREAADPAISGILASMWLWTGIGYHGLWFAAINKAAYLFAASFIIQGCYLFYSGFSRQIHFGVRPGTATWVGMTFIAYAAIVYPLIGTATGHSYPHMPMFGVTPCPVTIFTFGLLLLTTSAVPRWLLVIPFAWSLVGGSAAILLRVPQDWLLLVSGFIAAALIAFRDSWATRAAGKPKSA